MIGEEFCFQEKNSSHKIESCKEKLQGSTTKSLSTCSYFIVAGADGAILWKPSDAGQNFSWLTEILADRRTEGKDLPTS